MKHVTAQQFINAFHAAVEGNDLVREAWTSAPQYTSLLLARDDGVLKRISRDMGLSYWPELLNIDACFYEGAREPFLVSVAIEHENSAYSSFREANKLALLSVPLKVLITYPNERMEDPVFLDEYHKIICACAKGVGSALGQYLVVFGSRGQGSIYWRYYEWTEEQFVELRGES